MGLISDTHNLVRPAVHEALAGVSLILHAGDVGEPMVLAELETIAPVRAVWGNTDEAYHPLVASFMHRVGDVRIHVSHGHELGSPTPERLLATYPEEVIVYGHTHRQLVTRADGRVVVNPGAAGPRRFNLTPCVARLMITGRAVDVELVPLLA
ncbi:MAG: metallophosphoesterase family protein [Gemmatimonadetes bacterium]|nr:metallophosphoesterase family protein [Gemmatimonadota bacterium]